jgi:hypothetical protein
MTPSLEQIASLTIRDASRDVARVVSDVSVLCPRAVFESDNGPSIRGSRVCVAASFECPRTPSGLTIFTGLFDLPVIATGCIHGAP